MGGSSIATTSGSSLVALAPLYSQEVLLLSTHLAYDAGGGGLGGGGAALDPSALHNLSQVHSLVIPHTPPQPHAIYGTQHVSAQQAVAATPVALALALALAVHMAGIGCVTCLTLVVTFVCMLEAREGNCRSYS